MRFKHHIALFAHRSLFRNCISLLVILTFALQPSTTYAQAPQSATEYKLKAAFLYNFTRFIEWPAYMFSSATAPIVIGIVGQSPFGTFLETIVENEKIGTRSIVIKKYAEPVDIDNCHLLYICSEEPDKIGAALNAVSSKSVLTVNDAPSFARQGGMIQFYTDNNKIRMIINNAAAKKAGLSISSKLLSLAKVIN